MIVRVDPGSPVPLGEQLRAQIERLIVSGQLAPGGRLPAIRHLAADLGVARGTVARVYELLARDGLVVSARRAGTVVGRREDQRARKGAAADAAALDGPAEALALTAKQFGLAVDAARAALDRAWLAIDSPPPLDRARAVTE